MASHAKRMGMMRPHGMVDVDVEALFWWRGFGKGVVEDRSSCAMCAAWHLFLPTRDCHCNHKMNIISDPNVHLARNPPPSE